MLLFLKVSNTILFASAFLLFAVSLFPFFRFHKNILWFTLIRFLKWTKQNNDDKNESLLFKIVNHENDETYYIEDLSNT